MTPDAIEHLLLTRGAAQYGDEAVSQLEHALQCAALAAAAGEAQTLVVACLLHDLGHLLAPECAGQAEPEADRDGRHEFVVLPFLRPHAPPAVTGPIGLHVQAKRYLCRVDPAYLETLSPASWASLHLQGGVFSEDEAARFIARPHAAEALRLRRYDDAAKVAGRPVPPLGHYAGCLRQVLQPRRA